MSGETDLIFQLKSCSDAYLALCQIPGNAYTLSYEIALGINGASSNELRLGVDGEMKSSSSENLLDCNSQKDFWIRWDGGNIRFGKGDVVGEQEVLQWQHDDPYDINYVSLTSKNDQDGLWDIISQIGNQHMAHILT